MFQDSGKRGNDDVEALDGPELLKLCILIETGGEMGLRREFSPFSRQKGAGIHLDLERFR